MPEINMREPVQILPGITMRVQGREGTQVTYSADGAGGVTVRVDWRHAMEFWFEFHLDPRALVEHAQAVGGSRFADKVKAYMVEKDGR